MTPAQVCLALNAEKSYAEVAQKFMDAQSQQPVEKFCMELLDLAEMLDQEMGPWTLEPPGTMSTLRIQPEFLSALSMAWKRARPSTDKGWRYEMRTMVLILNGKYLTVRGSDLEDQIGRDLARAIGDRQPPPAASMFKGKKNKKLSDIDTAQEVPLEETV
jgi:hypothetical protein